MSSPTPSDRYRNEKQSDRYPEPGADSSLDAIESRLQGTRLNDDLELLRVERIVSNSENPDQATLARTTRTRYQPPPKDAFNEDLRSEHAEQSDEAPTTLRKLWVKIKKFPRFIRYFVYMTPAALVLLTPILLDLFALPESTVPVGGPGGVQLMWFGIWLEVVWLTLWLSRMICCILPYFLVWCAKLGGSSNSKKWKDIGYRLELHMALFLWMLAVICSFLPTVNSHRDESGDWSNGLPFIQWIDIVNKVIISLFVLACLNVVEKIIIQWIASSFHVRTYALRIETNKRDIAYLVQLYDYIRSHGHGNLEVPNDNPTSGTRTPLKAIQANARQAWRNVGFAANKVAGDFTGKKTLREGHPQRVVTELLRSTQQAHTLARMFYRALIRDGQTTLEEDDFQSVFDNSEDVRACFEVFDRDQNGDISMEELELVCNEIHLEKKAIAASLKDIDSVISKLDRVFEFLIGVITILVFVSIISPSASAALTTAGTAILGLAWMLQATAQEFLQSIIFVFVKHPFDVGDRVTIYGNTGSLLMGDDYYVQEIALLYTEFKKMEGHIVQAPNLLLNGLFILNQRRSNGLADPVELMLRFGTPAEKIEELKAKMLDYVIENNRDYKPTIITEVRTLHDVIGMKMNFIFFHKSNFQNELLRLQRHNKFTVELMRQMHAMGFESSNRAVPGAEPGQPIYWANISPPQSATTTTAAATHQPSPDVREQAPTPRPSHDQVIMRRARAESHVAFESAPDFGDVYDSRRTDTASGMSRLHSVQRHGTHENRTGAPMSPAMERVSTTGTDSQTQQQHSGWFRGRQQSVRVPENSIV